jgi:predicted dehydrogenase
MMNEKDHYLRWGILSTARINRALIEPIRISPRNELLAVASRSRAKVEDYAEEWDIPRAYGSYDSLLEDEEVDVIYISLPNSQHAHWTIRALEAGKHVLCEKPLAIDIREADEIIESGYRTGRIAAEAFMYRHHPQTFLVKELVERGEIGEVRVINSAFTFNLTKPGDVRLDKSLGGGCLWDVGCYPVNFSRYLAGSEPKEVFGWQILGESGVDEVFSGQMRFDNGIIAQFDCGFRSPFRAYLEIVGSKGSLFVSNPFKPEFGEKILLKTELKEEIIPAPDRKLYIGEVEDIADTVLNGQTQRISLEDSRANTVALLALLESASKGEVIRI